MDHSSNFFGKSSRLEGKYANYFAVGYNAYEFIFDFGQCYSDNEEAELSLRVVTSPFHAREFLRTLKKSIEEYDESYGNTKTK